MRTQITVRRWAVLAGVLGGCGLALVLRPSPGMVAQGTLGALTGSVTADRGEVRGARVKARDVANKVTYTVFTKGGRYQIPNLPPGAYEVRVLEEAFVSPVQPATVKAGATETVNVAVKARPGAESAIANISNAAGDYSSTPGAAGDIQTDKVELVDFDTLYPPSPAREVMLKNCFGCHGGTGGAGGNGAGGWHLKAPRTEAQWRRAVDHMFDPKGGVANMSPGVPEVTYDRVSMAEKESIIKYLTSIFGPGSKLRSLKVDPIVRDEDALSQALYVEYEVPPVDKKPFTRNGAPLAPFRMLHSPSVSTTEPGVVYMSGNQSGSIVRVDTKATGMAARTKEWRIETPTNQMVQPHGIIEREGKVFFVELTGEHFDELDPKTGKIQRSRIPTEGGGPHSVWPDSKGNFWYSYFAATGKVGRFNPKTGEVKEYTPLKDVSGYGLVVDKADRVWMATLNTSVVLMHDPQTDQWKQFPVSNPVRRVAPDSKGLVWAGEFYGNRLVSIDPVSSKVTEYEMPLKNGSAYDVWPDQDDNIWMTNHMYNSMVRFDQKTKKFTYFPYPQFAVYSPKIDRDREGTMWFCLNAGGQPGELAGLRPKGNVASR